MTQHDVQAVDQLKEARAKIRAELSKVIVGQNDVIDQTLISIFTLSAFSRQANAPLRKEYPSLLFREHQ